MLDVAGGFFNEIVLVPAAGVCSWVYKSTRSKVLPSFWGYETIYSGFSGI